MTLAWWRRTRIETLWPGRAEHGESPIWVERLQCLLMVDPMTKRLIAVDLGHGRSHAWPLGEPWRWLVEQAGTCRFLAGLDDRIIEFGFDLRPDGSIANRRIHLRLSRSDGAPDGMTCDRDGGLWIAHWGTGRISRFRPDGSRDRMIRLPVGGTTSLTFFGTDLDRLAVTTSAHVRPRQPGAGALYALRPGVRGLPGTGVCDLPGTGVCDLPADRFGLHATNEAE